MSNETPCLFCLRRDRPFTTVEHIFPESGGNDRYVLPRGAVCDPCNTGPLAGVDQALLDFFPIKAMRAMHGVPSKSGKLPVARMANAVITHAPPGNLHVTALNKAAFRVLGRDTDGNTRFRMTLASGGPPSDQATGNVARALYKICVECIACDRGISAALHAEFDPIREIVLGRVPFNGFIALWRAGIPNNEINLIYDIQRYADGRPLVPILLDYFGARIGTMMFASDVAELDRAAATPADVLTFKWRPKRRSR